MTTTSNVGADASREWEKIESAPDDTVVLAINPQRKQTALAFRNDQREWEQVTCDFTPMGIGFYPTHWMPIPTPPAGETK